ncbi:MAG TPA: DMT family transporter [Azospirillum sp.]|nr:DMT family transporter [Azospirillum sp.]
MPEDGSPMLANLAALGAALCWAAGGLIAITPVREIGSVAFNRIRMVIVFAMLGLAATVTGGWAQLSLEQAAWLALSGAVGVFLGDSALFWALGRLGPRRNVVIYASNAPMTALLGWLVLGESLAPLTLLGIVLVTAGVMLAVALRGGSHDWEAVRGSLLAGVGACLIAALCQAGGSILAKPALTTGADPTAAAAVRVGASGLLLWAGTLLPGERRALTAALRPRILVLIAANGLLGLGLGMTLLMIGLKYGNAGVAATLSATSPVLILPMLWVLTRQAPRLGAWIGAALAVAGVMLIVNR